MSRFSSFIQKQGTHLLANKRYAMLCALLLAIAPFTAWLSLFVVALVVLTKGWREGTLFLMPVATLHFALSLVSFTVSGAIVNTLLTFLPCYLAACTLYLTTSWRAVASVFFLQVLLVVVLLQIFLPEFIMAQYMYIQASIREAQPDGVLLGIMRDSSGFKQIIAANYLLGIQTVTVVFSATLSLMLARSVQAQLYYPGGFKKEALAFRGNKIEFFLLVAIFVAAMQYSIVAINILPILMFYSVLAGLSLCANALARKKTRGVFFLLVTPLVLLPFIAAPVYIIVGALDSLFNFRLYVPSDADKTT